MLELHGKHVIICPLCTITYVQVIEDNQITSKSDGNYVSSTEDVNISDIESDGFIADTPNTRDMQFSSDDSFLNTSFNTVIIYIYCRSLKLYIFIHNFSIIEF